MPPAFHFISVNKTNSVLLEIQIETNGNYYSEMSRQCKALNYVDAQIIRHSPSNLQLQCNTPGRLNIAVSGTHGGKGD